MPVKKVGFAVVMGFMVLMTAMLALLMVAAPVEAAGGTRAELSVTQITRSGISDTLATADGDGYKFSNNGYVFVEIRNSWSSAITATFVTPGTVDGLAISDLDVQIAAGQTKLIGPFPPSQYNQASGSDIGKVYLNWTSVVTSSIPSSATLAAYRVDQ